MDKKKIIILAIFVFFGLFAFSYANPIEQDGTETTFTTEEIDMNIDENIFKIEVNEEIPAFKANVLDGINVSINHNINNKKVGTYEVIFKATDETGRTKEMKHDFFVVDSTKPIITLNGTDLLLRINTPYKELGAKAIDNYDGDISNKIVIKNNIDVSKKGKYTVSYNVTDKSKNKAKEVKRNVQIVDDTKLLEKIKEAEKYINESSKIDKEIKKSNKIIEDKSSTQETIDEEEKILDNLIQEIVNQTFIVKFVDYDNKVLKEEKVKYGEKATKPENPVRIGYVFTSWNKKYDAVYENLTIKAQYEIENYKIEYDLNGAIKNDNREIYTIETPSFKLSKVEKVGYEFLYWMDESGKKISEIKKGSNGNIKLKAIFKENENTSYKIKYYYELIDGSYKEEIETKYGKTNKEIKLNPSKSGYIVDEKASLLNGSIKADGSLELKVTFILNTYKAYFYINNKLYKTLEFKYQEDIKKPEYTPEEGYTFSDWKIDKSMPSKDVSYYGTTEKKKFNVIFKYYKNGALVENQKEVKYGEDAVAPTPDELVYVDGQTPYYLSFKNWNSSLKNIKENKTIEAVYEKLGIASTRLYRLKLLKRPENGEGRNPIWYEELGKKKNIKFVLSDKKIGEIVNKAKKSKKHEAVLSLNESEIYNYMTDESKLELKEIEEAAIRKYEKINKLKKDCKFEWYVLKYNTNDGWHLDGEVTSCKSIFD